mgnify:FL=1
MEFKHKPVLFDECMRMLDVSQDKLYMDGTLGGGGHSEGILERGGRLIGIDRDSEAIAAAKKRLERFRDRATFVKSNYADVKTVLETLDIPSIDGALLDLGVSSYQLDNPERGFSYMHDARLDMRMNRDDPVSAYEIVNEYSEEQLSRIIYEYGEERWAKRIARFISEERKKAPLETTFQLESIIKAAIPQAARKNGSHPAKRTFQAIRIEVNGELEKLKKALEDIFDSLSSGGRFAVITFHSLEDRIVKETFASFLGGCTCPKEFPICVCGNKPRGKLINRKPITASETELEENPRSRSAKLRGIIKL